MIYVFSNLTTDDATQSTRLLGKFLPEERLKRKQNGILAQHR